MCSIWQPRTIVWTDDTLYVSRGDVIVETIPLHEITSVDEMNEDSEVETLSHGSASIRQGSSMIMKALESDGSDKKSEVERLKAVGRGHLQSILMLKTITDGFNFGRIYYLNPNTDISSRVLASQIWTAACAAKARVEQKSRFRKSQDFVMSFQQSTIFQMTMAALIMLVSTLLLQCNVRIPKHEPNHYLILDFIRTSWSTPQRRSSSPHLSTATDS